MLPKREFPHLSSPPKSVGPLSVRVDPGAALSFFDQRVPLVCLRAPILVRLAWPQCRFRREYVPETCFRLVSGPTFLRVKGGLGTLRHGIV